MANITFLTFYSDYAIGVYVLASILQDAGHNVSAIFFKLPRKKEMAWFKENPVNIEEVNAYGDIIGSNDDVGGWTHGETDLLVEKIRELTPDLLCVSSKSTHAEIARQTLSKIRSQISCPIIAGGYGPTLDPHLYANLVDFVFVGEAENAICEIAFLAEQGTSLKGLDNICYHQNGRLVMNPLRQPDIHLFRRQQIPTETYYIDQNQIFGFQDRQNLMKTHAYSTFFGRGCISACSYCSAGQWRKIYEKEGIRLSKRRNRALRDVMDELLYIKDKGYTFVHFRDEFLYADAQTLKEFFKSYEREICLPFWAYLVPEQILNHPEILTHAVDAGFVDTEIGFQSGSDDINRRIFNRRIPNAKTLRYTRLLAQYHLNMKYDFIIFNPAETRSHINVAIQLIQALPKERSYLSMGRLHYFPVSPIVGILKDYDHVRHSFQHYYALALQCLLAFVMTPRELNGVLAEPLGEDSWRRLKSVYQTYLQDHGLGFPVGTHEVPESITAHRYERIIRKQGYREVIIMGDRHYFEKMSHVFDSVPLKHFINDNAAGSGLSPGNEEIMDRMEATVPLFVCSGRKGEIKTHIQQHFPRFRGRVYV